MIYVFVFYLLQLKLNIVMVFSVRKQLREIKYGTPDDDIRLFPYFVSQFGLHLCLPRRLHLYAPTASRSAAGNGFSVINGADELRR